MGVIRYTRLRMSVAYRSGAALSKDYFSMLTDPDKFGVRIHVPVRLGLRSSGIRGVFLESNANKLLAGTTVCSIPLASATHAENVASFGEFNSERERVAAETTVAQMQGMIDDDEFKKLAEVFLVTLRFMWLRSKIPNYSIHMTEKECNDADVLLRHGVNPWVRIIDDEAFDDDFVLELFGQVLDRWQRDSYNELVRKLQITVKKIFYQVKPPGEIRDFQRFFRIFLARMERYYPVNYYSLPNWRKSFMRSYCQYFSKEKRPPTIPYLIPLYDLINHSNIPNIVVRHGSCPDLGGVPGVWLSTTRPIDPGDELCRCYDFSMSKVASLFRFGFLPMELMVVPTIDQAGDHYLANRHRLLPGSAQEAEREKEMSEQISALEAKYRAARGKV
jgi:hypothetical protein